MRLIDVKIGDKVRIIDCRGGRGVESKLRQLGISPGDTITIERHAPLGGPLLIQVNGRLVALGKGVASKINVEEF
jgi:ferrous iron transport protein A